MNNYVGHTFGAYRLTTLVGRSAYTEAYLGEHTRVQRPTVIKLLTFPLPAGGWVAFQQTCAKASGLVHPGIVPVLDFDQQEGTAFLVQEYLPTGSLGQHCPPGAHVPLRQVAGWVQRIADALSYAHAQQVLHLGLTPSNLLFTQQQDIVVSDFGLAAFARSLLPPSVSRSAESVAYLAPEQLQGQAGPASDQYALAICAYEWLCGVLPFQGEPAAIIAGHLFTPPPAPRSLRPDLPAEVEQVLLTALRKQPAERFGSIQAFAHAFTQASSQANNAPAFGSPAPSLSSTPGPQVPPAPLSNTQPQPTSASAPVAPGFPAPGAALSSSSPTPPPPSWPQTPSGPDQMALPPYPQPASASPRISRRTAIIGAVGVGAAGVLTTLCTRTALLPFLVKSLSSRGASAAATPTVAPNPLLLYTYRGHKSPRSLVWSPDSTRLISTGNDDPLIHVWDALTGSHASTFDSRSIKPANTDALDGPHLAWMTNDPCIGWIDGNNPPVVHVTNLVSGQEVRTSSTSDYFADVEQATIRWSPNGNYLAVDIDEGIGVLDVATGNPVATFPGPDSVASFDFAWSPDSQRVAAIYSNNAISVWELSSARKLGSFQKYANSFVSGGLQLVWSSDSKSLASIGSASQIDIWDAQDGGQLYTYTNIAESTELVGWSADNSLFATDTTGKTFVWSASTHQLLHTLPTYTPLGNDSAIWAPNTKNLAAYGEVTLPDGNGYSGDAFIIWDAATGQQLTSYISPGAGDTPVIIVWSPNGKYIASTYEKDNGVYIWSAP